MRAALLLRFACASALLVSATVSYGQWFPKEQEDYYASLWPASVPFPKDGKFYSLPQAYQHGGGVHSPQYNIAANADPGKSRRDTPGNANREFPWGFPAGLHNSRGWTSVKRVFLPGPIAWWRERLPSSPREPAAVAWEYPQGTVFGEMLLLKDLGGREWAFEVRLREKKGGSWESTPYRIFAGREDLPPGAYKIEHEIAAGSSPALGVGKIDVELWDVGYLEPAEWLTKPFKPSRIFPTTFAEGSVVPVHYQGNVTKCAVCHTQTLKHVSEFDARLPGPRREWYGFSRGSDQVYSFHIFDPDCISYNGFVRPVRLNSSLPLVRRQ